jgi:hypothetical protein
MTTAIKKSAGGNGKSLDAPTLKNLINLADAHQVADEYIAGQYQWNDGACSIGCTIRDAKNLGILPKSTTPDSHKSLAKTGVPELVWRLCDSIFEGLAQEHQSAWTPRFLRSIKPNADYSLLPSRIMARCAKKLSADAIDPIVAKNCLTVASLWDCRAAGEEPDQAEWDAAWQQADAAWQQADAAWQQADAARQEFWIWCADMLCEELSR